MLLSWLPGQVMLAGGLLQLRAQHEHRVKQ
jgi:hypothetical protein